MWGLMRVRPPRALETALESEIAALDQAGARAEVRGETIAARLTQESQHSNSVSDNLSDATSRATEIVADRSARLIGVIETAKLRSRPQPSSCPIISRRRIARHRIVTAARPS